MAGTQESEGPTHLQGNMAQPSYSKHSYSVTRAHEALQGRIHSQAGTQQRRSVSTVQGIRDLVGKVSCMRGKKGARNVCASEAALHVDVGQ